MIILNIQQWEIYVHFYKKNRDKHHMDNKLDYIHFLHHLQNVKNIVMFLIIKNNVL